MGANCGKEEPASTGFTSSTAVERSVSRKLAETTVGKSKSDLKGGSQGRASIKGGEPDLVEDGEIPEKVTKALKGKALLAACMLTEEDEDDDEQFVDFNDDKRRPNIPGIVSDSPTATERERRAEKTRRSTPNNTGSRRRSKRFAVKEGGKQTKALRGKALMQACMDGSYSSDEDL
mmetsp:Transcript_7999/g.16718  ORF Transcript_7999/g.16718 Transcript_7999/m.16718 type:complete len:176 (-) Transcript_7999:53-580(-)